MKNPEDYKVSITKPLNECLRWLKRGKLRVIARHFVQDWCDEGCEDLAEEMCYQLNKCGQLDTFMELMDKHSDRLFVGEDH